MLAKTRTYVSGVLQNFSTWWVPEMKEVENRCSGASRSRSGGCTRRDVGTEERGTRARRPRALGDRAGDRAGDGAGGGRSRADACGGGRLRDVMPAHRDRKFPFLLLGPGTTRRTRLPN